MIRRTGSILGKRFYLDPAIQAGLAGRFRREPCLSRRGWILTNETVPMGYVPENAKWFLAEIVHERDS
jgi:hypothetical protein